MHELALFHGAGGGLLASRLLGWRTVCGVEFSEYRRLVALKKALTLLAALAMASVVEAQLPTSPRLPTLESSEAAMPTASTASKRLARSEKWAHAAGWADLVVTAAVLKSTDGISEGNPLFRSGSEDETLGLMLGVNLLRSWLIRWLNRRFGDEARWVNILAASINGSAVVLNLWTWSELGR